MAMTTFNARWRTLAAASVAAACLGACHSDANGSGNGGGGGGTPPPQSSSVSYTTFTNNTFAANANSTPLSVDSIKFDFDADDNPTEFDTLVMSGTY
jgi:hypothetical protein